jgi:aryl-alcohol dehydrogenase-like predicted oxidoreductase
MRRTRLRTSPLGGTGLEITRVSFDRSERIVGRAAEAEVLPLADRHGSTPGAVAVAWTLRNPAVTGAITGSAGRPRSIPSSPRPSSSSPTAT